MSFSAGGDGVVEGVHDGQTVRRRSLPLVVGGAAAAAAAAAAALAAADAEGGAGVGAGAGVDGGASASSAAGGAAAAAASLTATALRRAPISVPRAPISVGAASSVAPHVPPNDEDENECRNAKFMHLGFN